MDYHFFLIGLPVVLAFLVALLPGLVKSGSVVFGGLLCAAFWAAAIALVPVVSAGGEQLISIPWVPELGVELVTEDDGFQRLVCLPHIYHRRLYFALRCDVFPRA